MIKLEQTYTKSFFVQCEIGSIIYKNLFGENAVYNNSDVKIVQLANLTDKIVIFELVSSKWLNSI